MNLTAPTKSVESKAISTKSLASPKAKKIPLTFNAAPKLTVSKMSAYRQLEKRKKGSQHAELDLSFQVKQCLDKSLQGYPFRSNDVNSFARDLKLFL